MEFDIWSTREIDGQLRKNDPEEFELTRHHWLQSVNQLRRLNPVAMKTRVELPHPSENKYSINLQITAQSHRPANLLI